MGRSCPQVAEWLFPWRLRHHSRPVTYVPHRPRQEVLLISDDEEVIDEVSMVAQTLGVPVRHQSGSARASPSALEQAGAGLVLVSADVELGMRPPGAVLLTRTAAACAGDAEVIQLTRRERLTEVLAAVAQERPGPIVGVQAAAGGLGATTLAAAMAVAAAPSSLVELDPLGIGFDAMFGTEEEVGLRWPDFAGLDSPVAGARIMGDLVEAGGVRLLGTRCVGDAMPPDWLAQRHVLRAVAARSARTVADLGRAADPRFWPELDAVVLLVARDPIGVLAGARCAARLTTVVRRVGAVAVTRKAHAVPSDEVAAVLEESGARLVGGSESDRAIRSAAEAGAGGDWPIGLRRGPVARLARTCWQWVGAE